MDLKTNKNKTETEKQEPSVCCLQETTFRYKDTHRLKVKSWKKIFHVNGNQKKAGVAILISDKKDFKLLEENIGRTLYDINQSKILFDLLLEKWK